MIDQNTGPWRIMSETINLFASPHDCKGLGQWCGKASYDYSTLNRAKSGF